MLMETLGSRSRDRLRGRHLLGWITSSEVPVKQDESAQAFPPERVLEETDAA
jgi:hypothetical protein